MKKILYILFFLFSLNLLAKPIVDTTKIYGVTIDNVSNLKDIKNSLSNHSKKMTARIVFDEFTPASFYKKTIDSLKGVSFIMGEVLDSYYVKHYSIDDYIDRTKDYMNHFSNDVDIWEVGNEVNGEWLGNTDTVIAKISGAYDVVKSLNKKTALTLYYNHSCWSDSLNEMFIWAENYIPSRMKQGLDYLLVSYYEDDCKHYQPNWQDVFDRLHKIFPNSKLGIGECGTQIDANKSGMAKRYYELTVSTESFIGGYFWWHYNKDCIPMDKPLWSVIDTSILK